ncbi:MAG: LLM class flavin-dependent oxidoreductase [Chloroflexi bacterium]|nr:LLM class flavin-dependent oxidoreductase [Chloroflexota bacterium]
MKVGICVKFKNSSVSPRPFREVYEETIEYVRVADSLGFDQVCVPEHHSLDVGYNPTPFLTLTALARETKRIGLCAQPLLLPLYNPVAVAEQLAVLDILSNGRAILGLGVGYREADFKSFGVPFRQRGARMNEGVEILLRALRERNVSFKGKFFDISGVDVTPRPLQQPHPKIFMTTGSPPAVDRAVRFGLPVNMQPHKAIDEGLYVYYCQKLVESGRDPRAVDVMLLTNGFIAKDAARALEAAKPHFEASIGHVRHMVLEHARHNPALAHLNSWELAVARLGLVVGSPQTWRQAVQSHVDALRGPVPIGSYNFFLWPEGMPLNEALEALELFAREVAPGIRSRDPIATTGNP